MSQALQKYLEQVMVYADRNEEDAARVRAELEDHLVSKITEFEAGGLSTEDATLKAIGDLGSAKAVGCGLRRHSSWVRTYLFVAPALLAVDYSLLLGRFYWFGFGSLSAWVYMVLNFPFSIVLLWVEKKPNEWWYTIFGRRFEAVFNDEIGILLAHMILTLLEAMLITLVLLRAKTWWRKKLSIRIMAS
jgi:hypothetical protein